MKSSRVIFSSALAALFATAAIAQTPQPTAPSPTAQPAPAVAPRAHATSPKAKSRAPSGNRTAAKFDAELKASTARAKFSDPSKPGTLKLSLPWADVQISGTDGDEVVVTSTLSAKKAATEVDEEGFRRLDEDVSFELTEKSNVVSLSVVGEQGWGAHGAEFRIEVPRNTNLVLRTQSGGDIAISGVNGDLDINSMNGDVKVTDLASSAIINTMNGEVLASFRSAPTKPVSITSMNGEIDLRLPNDTKANIRMRTHNGSIRTNFPAGALQTKTENAGEGRRVTVVSGPDVPGVTREAVKEAVREAAQAARAIAVEAPAAPFAPMPPFVSGKSITGTLNGGGVDIALSSMNGTITLRRAD